MGMQTVVCGGLILFVVVIVLLLRRDPEETVQTPPRRRLGGGAGVIQPRLGGGSGPETVDIWDEIRAQGQPALTASQTANRQALEQAGRIWELTGNVGLPDVTILHRGTGRDLGPGEATVEIILSERPGQAMRRFYGDGEG